MKRRKHYVKGHYILVDHEPVPCTDLFEWAEWFETADRRVAHTHVLDLVEVSTVFLGLDHSRYLPSMNRPPILFETMAFWLGDGYEMDRCATWKAAEIMHQEMVAYVKTPKAIWQFIKRHIHDALKNMRDDWKRHWRDLRGIEPYLWERDWERARDQLERTYG
jgi:hypothetical protein